MTRSVDRFEGLALLGRGSAGPFSLALPGLLYSEGLFPTGSDPAREIGLESLGSEVAGTRRLRWRRAGEAWPMEVPIAAPEISGRSPSPVAIAESAWMLHGSVSAEEWQELRSRRPALLVLGNARTLFHEGEPFIRAVDDIRREMGPEPLLWAPRTALPHRVALLTYLSVDIIDTTAALWEAAQGRFLDPTFGAIDPAAAEREGLCRCPGCRGEGPDRRRQHSVEMMAGELARARAALSAGRLRELVESRVSSEPLLAELLRYADRRLADPLESRSPVVSHSRPTYVLRESARRPEVRRFRQRFLERYRPPPSKRVLLLLPCSRTKPYRHSRSHRRFSQALLGLSGVERLHAVSVTSPLGLVPREIEDLYPARHYDIPVTGDWEAEERRWVREALTHLLRTGGYESLLLHLDPKEYGFLNEELSDAPPASWTISDDRTTTREALAALHEAGRTALGQSSPVEGGPMAVVREELEALAAMQFGREAAGLLFRPPVRLQGRPWFQRLTDGHGTDLATWQEARGLFQLTAAGGARLEGCSSLVVEIDPAVTLNGDLFTPGVRAADPLIRVGDAVRILREGRLVAVGEAELPGPLMSGLSHGCAVRVRHRVRVRPTDAPTAT